MDGHGMGIGKGRVLCEGAVCVRQAVGRMSWETLGNVFGKLGGGAAGDKVIPRSGGGERDHVYRCRHTKLYLELSL